MEVSSKVGPCGGDGSLDVGAHPLTASRCNANGSVAVRRTRIAAHAAAAESFLPVVVPPRVAPTQAMVTHGVVDIAALDETTIKNKWRR
jgi:hypothetical protein